MDMDKLRAEMSHFEDGDRFRDKGDLARAIQEWQAVIRINPDNKEAHDRLGKAYQKQGNDVLAEKEYREILRIDPKNADAHYSLSSLFKNRNYIVGQMAERTEALKLDPSNAARYERSRKVIQPGDLAEAQKHYEQGNAYDEAGDTGTAIDEWNLATQLNPNLFDAHYNLGIAYADADDLTHAVDEMEIAYSLDPDDADARRELIDILIERGDTLLAQNDAAHASADWERVTELDSRNALAHLKLGQLYADKFVDGDAEAHLRAAIAGNPFLTDAYDKLAKILLAENRKPEAISILHQALNTFHDIPSHGEVMSRLGGAPEIQNLPLDTTASDLARDLADLELESGDADQAMAALEQAEPEAEDAAIWRDIAQVFQRNGDSESYEIAQNRAQALERGELERDDAEAEEPEDPRTRAALAEQHFNLGEELYLRGEHEKAFEEYSEAVRLNPDHADAHYSLGLIYQADAEYGLAAKEFRAVLSIDPTSEDAQTHLGQVTRELRHTEEPAAAAAHDSAPKDSAQARAAEQYFDQGEAFYAHGRFDEAWEKYENAVHLNPNHSDAHYSLGLLYKRENDLDLAEKEFREAVRSDPNKPDAHNELGKIYDTREDWQNAVREYRAALKSEPENPEAQESLIWDLLETNDLLDAQQELKRATLDAAVAAELWEEMGKMYEERRGHADAMVAYRRALELDKNLKEARAGLKRLGG